MKTVILDGYTINPGDLSWSSLEALSQVKVRDRTPAEQLAETIGDAEAIFTSKNKITAEIMDACPDLKFIGVLATGFDNIDIEAAKARGIAVCNVPSYSTDTVAQHTFALILEITNHVGLHNAAVQNGEWTSSPDFCLIKSPIQQLAGKSLGIIGYGNIGRKVAAIAEAFGMTVNIYSRDREAAMKSDIVTLHCPATAENRGFINADFISKMKDGAILINNARGQLIHEQDVADALNSGKIYGAGLDTVRDEPIAQDNPLLKARNCYITPHISWTAVEGRQRLATYAVENVAAFLRGQPKNIVNGL